MIRLKGKRTFELNGYHSLPALERDLPQIVEKYRHILDADVEEVGLGSYGYMLPEAFVVTNTDTRTTFILTVRYRFVPHNPMSANKFKLKYQNLSDIGVLLSELNLADASTIYSPIAGWLLMITLFPKSVSGTSYVETFKREKKQIFYDLEQSQIIENVNSNTELIEMLRGKL